jgi:archaellum component FlaG (FlaF/FlaG flagellin family)
MKQFCDKAVSMGNLVFALVTIWITALAEGLLKNETTRLTSTAVAIVQ